MLQWTGLLYYFWCFVIQTVFELINCIAITNRDLTLYQLFYNELEPATTLHKPNLKTYRTIGLYCEVFILLKKRPKVYKVKAKTEPGRFLAVLGSKFYLVYMLIRNIVIKTPFIKLYEPKNSLTLKRVSKSIDSVVEWRCSYWGLHRKKGIVRSAEDRQYRFFGAYNS